MSRIATDGLAWYICWLVGLSQSWAVQNGWTSWDAIWMWTLVGPRNHVLDRGPIPPMRRGNFGENIICMANNWLKEQGQQFYTWNPSFGEMPDQVHFSCTCRKLCWKVTEYDVHTLWLLIVIRIGLRTFWIPLVLSFPQGTTMENY